MVVVAVGRAVVALLAMVVAVSHPLRGFGPMVSPMLCGCCVLVGAR